MSKNPESSNNGLSQTVLGGIVGGIIVAVIGVLGVIYAANRAAEAVITAAIMPIEATQTAEAKLTSLAPSKTPTLATWTPVAPPTSTPTLSPSPTSTLEDLRAIALSSFPKDKILSINPNTALYAKAQEHNLGFATSYEYVFPLTGGTYIAQVFQRGIAYVMQGDWDNVKFTEKSASPLARDPAAAEAFKFSLGQYQMVIDSESFLMKQAQVHYLGLPFSSEVGFQFNQEAYVAQQFADGLICAKSSTKEVFVFPR